jgi:hypothetical protein
MIPIAISAERSRYTVGHDNLSARIKATDPVTNVAIR